MSTLPTEGDTVSETATTETVLTSEDRAGIAALAALAYLTAMGRQDIVSPQGREKLEKVRRLAESMRDE